MSATLDKMFIKASSTRQFYNSTALNPTCQSCLIALTVQQWKLGLDRISCEAFAFSCDNIAVEFDLTDRYLLTTERVTPPLPDRQPRCLAGSSIRRNGVAKCRMVSSVRTGICHTAAEVRLGTHN